MKRFISALAGVFFLIGILFLFIDVLSFDRSFYTREYRKLGTAEDIGISREDLGLATETLLDYLKDERDDLVVEADFESGGVREVYNDREKAHMVDVKALYQTGRKAVYAALGISTALLLILLISSGKEKKLPVIKGYIDSNLILLIMITLLGGYAVLDFNSFWTGFHHIFFTNDLWLLDPRTSVLINMVPEQFFFDLVTRIAVSFAITAAVLLLIALTAKKRIKDRYDV